MNIIEKIKEERMRQNMSQAELARKSGIAQGSISRIEQEGGNTSIETVERLMEALGMEMKIEVKQTKRTSTLERMKQRLIGASTSIPLTIGSEMIDLSDIGRMSFSADSEKADNLFYPHLFNIDTGINLKYIVVMTNPSRMGLYLGYRNIKVMTLEEVIDHMEKKTQKYAGKYGEDIHIDTHEIIVIDSFDQKNFNPNIAKYLERMADQVKDYRTTTIINQQADHQRTFTTGEVDITFGILNVSNEIIIKRNGEEEKFYSGSSSFTDDLIGKMDVGRDPIRLLTMDDIPSGKTATLHTDILKRPYIVAAQDIEMIKTFIWKISRMKADFIVVSDVHHYMEDENMIFIDPSRYDSTDKLYKELLDILTERQAMQPLPTMHDLNPNPRRSLIIIDHTKNSIMGGLIAGRSHILNILPQADMNFIFCKTIGEKFITIDHKLRSCISARIALGYMETAQYIDFLDRNVGPRLDISQCYVKNGLYNSVPIIGRWV